MHLVRQKEENGTKRVRGAVLALAALALAAGCSQGPGASVAPGQEGRPQGAAGPAGDGARGAPGAARDSVVTGVAGAQAEKSALLAAQQAVREAAGAKAAEAARAARARAAGRWRIARLPPPAPAPPAAKPDLATPRGLAVEGSRRGLPPVLTRVPTRDKVVFLTVDDGAREDPEFVRMARDLGIPYTPFLGERPVRDDRGSFLRMRAQGVPLGNRTLDGRYLRSLTRAQQKREICGMQELMEKRFGARPALLRPPFGAYDRHTLEAAASCGVKAVLLWGEEAFPDHLEYREAGRRLRPGDIVLARFGGRADGKGAMAGMVRTLLKDLAAQGFAPARLEDYV